jgi:50S ribosome-binding GTPase
MGVEALFKRIVADLDAVHHAYESAGLLTDAGPGSLALTLLGGGEDADRFRRETLLVDALVRNRVARLVFDRRGPRHIVVFGGNNVGKSTVVNILAAARVASTSPEGGHTRHARAFSAAPFSRAPAPLFAWNPYAFNRFKQVASDRLPTADFDTYAVLPITGGALPDDVVLWDSPDCDSIGSARYLPTVIETAAAADLVVYVTSVEKYAVADLVEWLFELSDAGIPILECLNKTPKKDRLLVMRKQTDDVFPAVSQRLGLPAPSPRVVVLRYMTDGEEADLWGAGHPEAAELREAALANLSAHDDIQQARTALRSVLRRIERVLEPARMELSVRSAWNAAVRTAVAAFVASYENTYLAGGAVIDPFKKLNAELLELLNPDIPHLNEVIRRLRAVQRIPTEILKAAWRLVSERGEMAKDARLAPELRAYATAHKALSGTLLERIDTECRIPRHHPFWDRLSEEWESQTARLADEFSQATVAHMQQTDAEVRVAAQDILRALQQRPNILRLLRTARVSTDIGGLLIGFILPGHGQIMHDLLKDIVIAPAMLGATGFAAEYAVEGYVAQRRNQIVEKLKADAREMAAVLYIKPLDALGDAVMTRVGALGIDREQLDRIPANLLRLQQEDLRTRP